MNNVKTIINYNLFKQGNTLHFYKKHRNTVATAFTKAYIYGVPGLSYYFYITTQLKWVRVPQMRIAPLQAGQISRYGNDSYLFPQGSIYR